MRRIISLASVLAIASLGLLGASGSSAVALNTPTIRIGDVTMVEGDAGNAAVKIPVDLSGPSDTIVKVPYQVKVAADGTADGQDAILKTGTLAFAISAVSKAVSVTVIGDTSVETAQHIIVQLGTPTGNATVVDPIGGLTITDDDSDGVNLGVEASIGDITVTESDTGTHLAYLPVTLSRPAPTALYVSFVADCSTASLLTDVTARRTGRINFLAGQRAKVLSFKIKADTAIEDVESLGESITAGVGSLTVLESDGTATIVDNDGSYGGGGQAVPGFSTEALPSGSTFDPGAVDQIEPIQVSMDGSALHYPEGTGTLNSGGAKTNSDGSQVLFSSYADNLVPGDTNGLPDLFVRDRAADTTERVNVKPDGSQITTADTNLGTFLWPNSISANGRYVAFVTGASLVPADTPVGTGSLGRLDVYVFDRVTHNVDLVSSVADGTAAGGAYGEVSISAGGRYVAFVVHGYETKLMSTNNSLWPFVHDRQTGSTTRVLSTPVGYGIDISTDGRTVVAGSLGPTCDDVDQKLVAIDLLNGTTERIDVTTAGEPAAEGAMSEFLFSPTVSGDGRYVGFNSFAWNLIPGMSGPTSGWAGSYPAALLRTYIRDRQAATTNTAPHQLTAGGGRQLSIDDSGQHLVAMDGTGMGTLYNLPSSIPQLFGLPFVTNVGPYAVAADRSLSGDGHVVVFSSLTPQNPGATTEIYAQRVN